LKLSES